jgi:hypothetical protein
MPPVIPPQPCRLNLQTLLWKFPPGALHPQRRERPLGGIVGEKCPVILSTNDDFHAKCRNLLHAANLRHGTDGFTSPPKEKSDGRVRTRELGYQRLAC